VADRLTRVLGGPETRRLRERIRERMARGLPLTGSLSLPSVSPDERAAIDQLLGRKASAGVSVSVPLGKLDELLRTSGIWPDGLASAVVALTGAVVVRSDAAAAAETGWAQALEPLADLASRREELSSWHAGLVSSGLIRRLAGNAGVAALLVEQLCHVLDQLPAEPEQVSSFAARVLGSAHRLDDGLPLTTLVLGGAREIGGAPDGAGASWRRMVWASVGLLRDELSSVVLTVGLPGDPTSGTGRALAAWQESGQPVVLTLRQLLTDPPRFEVDGLVVSVCENRSLVGTAAEHLGSACAPLVCSSGQPGAAVLLLLTKLVAGGARLRYHGDFDWYGIRIANFLHRHCPWEPWQFTAADYTGAVAAHNGSVLSGTAVAPVWDALLGEAMSRENKQVEEEVVFEALISDLCTEP
jgi:uncharacterized protein (TIGR02679 family)